MDKSVFSRILQTAIMATLCTAAPLAAGAANNDTTTDVQNTYRSTTPGEVNYNNERVYRSTTDNVRDRVDDVRNDVRYHMDNARDDVRTGVDNIRNDVRHNMDVMRTDVRTSDGAMKDNIERMVKPYDDVDVDVDNGMVTLTGTVRSQQERDAVISKTRQVSGVSSVKDELRIDADRSGSVSQYLDDAAVTTVVKGKFLAQEGLDSLDISVETTNGVVTLTGDVDEAAQVGLAERVAKEADGVRQVVNKLTVNR